MDLVFKTKKLIEDKDLILPGSHVLVGVSGGIDSMTMLDVLQKISNEIGFTLSAIHINHSLRGLDSDADESFVEGFCKSKDMAFHVATWHGPAKSENLQEAARCFRYDSFLKYARSINADIIAVAHNLEDQAETILINLIRGTGLDGLCGISMAKEVEEGVTLIRPFLQTSRKEIEEYAKVKSLNFRNDQTNEETKYTRNFIRHKIIPLFKEINESVVGSISQMAKSLEQDESYIKSSAIEAFDRLVLKREHDKIILADLAYNQLAPAVRMRILKIAYSNLAGSVAGINRDQLIKMDQIAMAKKETGSYNLAKDLAFEKRGTELAIFRKKS